MQQWENRDDLQSNQSFALEMMRGGTAVIRSFLHDFAKAFGVWKGWSCLPCTAREVT